MTDILTPEQRLNNLIGLNKYFAEHDAHEHRVVLDWIIESYDSQIRRLNEELQDEGKAIDEITDEREAMAKQIRRFANSLRVDETIAKRFELDYKPILSRADATDYEKQLVADINTLLAGYRRLRGALAEMGESDG